MALSAVGAAGCHFDNHSDWQAPSATLQTSDGVAYLAHEIVVRVRPGVQASAVSDAIAKVGGKIIDEPGPLADLGYRRIRLDTPTADAAIAKLVATATFDKAERSFLVHAFDTASPPAAPAPPPVSSTSTTPNDPRYGELWGMAKIGAPAAWDSGTGSASVLVAVSDTGMDYNHPDLAANVWTNPGEIPGNGKDDDGNGYVDDIHGWDFANNDADPMDDNGHGTHVSGTIGGVGNNGVGVVGVNWKVRIMATKFLASNGGGSLWNGAQTILYAAKMHARVVNASWGCLGPSCYASYMEDALKTLNDAGGLFMAAAGNSANDNDAYPSYPANYAVANVVAVAATDSSDVLASFSDWGATRVHLAAPGVGILSSLPNASYASWNGTSMATPHVTGAAALFLATRPDATVAEVKQKLMDTADRVPSLTNKVVSGGRLNVAKLIAAAGTPPAAPAGFDAQPGDRSDVILSWRPNMETDLAGYRVKWGTTSGLYTQTRDLARTEIGTRVTGLVHGTTYFFVVTASNDKGQTSAASVEKMVVARDRTAPPQVVDLTAAGVAGGTALCELVDSSGAFSSYWAAENAVDGTVETAWISPGRYDDGSGDAQPEWLTTRLYVPSLIDAVDLAPNPAYPQFFPVDFDIEISTDAETWTAVGGLRNAVAQAGVPVRVSFPPTLASEVRLHVVRSYRHDSGVSYASVAELTVHEASSAPDRLTLSFTAPGDDPGEGRATSYDVRRATAPLSAATFAAAAPVATGAPLPAGTPESVALTGLGGETTYFFALTATDEAGNVSPLSNVASATTLLIPPSTITDLAVVPAPSPPHPGMVTLTWTAPGADGKTGQAARYDLRASKTPLTAGNFAAAVSVPGVPAPAPAGTVETFAVDGLTLGQTYYFAIRALDAGPGGGAAGGVSNVVSAAPANGADHTPPAAVVDLTARLSNASVKIAARVDSSSSELSPQRAGAMLVDGDVSTAWMTTAADRAAPAWVILDLGAVQPLVKLRANPSTLDLVGSYPQDFDLQTSVDKVNWTTAVHVEGLVGEFGTWNDWSTPVTFARYVRLNVTKRGPAAGASVYVAMGELEAYALTPALDADLTWVAPGDDGFAGTAARYDLRVATAPLTDATFAAATPVATLSPLHGGMIEVLHLPSLPAESTLYYALKTVDGSGNWSGLSNVATLTTPGVAPAPPTDLTVTAASTSSLAVSFTATGDDGVTGRATAYELRYAKTPISPVSWDAAAVAPSPAPQAAGARETINVAGLESATTYYLAVEVIDDAGNRSPMSNVASGTTRDGTTPAAVTDLVASQVDAAQRPPVTMSITDSTGSYSPDTAAANLLDANDTTLWISAGRTQVQPETVTFGLGPTARTLGRLRMRAGTGYKDLFPVDFKVEVQVATGGVWKTVVSETGFTTAGGWEEWALGAVPAVAARLTVTKTVAWNGKLYTALGDLELYEDPTDYGKLRLSWTAPGDDGATGTATTYDVRRAPTSISDATFAGATPVGGAPAPHPAGYLERFDVTGLAAETTACFALKAADEAGNTSAASNAACATTPGMPPATITDLAVGPVTAATATLTFTAPGADGAVGTAARYEVRRSDGRISEATWGTATVVDNVAAPKPAGTAESITVTGLTGLTTYRFAVRAIDAAGNAGAISNNAVGTTADDIPPARVTDLAATTNGAQGGSLTLGWTAPGDNGMTGQARSYDVRVSSQPITDATFAAATPVAVGAPKAGGTHETATLTGLGAEQLYYVALKTLDPSGNASALSNLASARTRDEAPSAITDLAVIGGSGRDVQQATLVIQWTAPGDDATVGTATSYDIRFSTSPLTSASFAAATAAAPGVAPAPAGTRQQYTLTGLSAGQKYYVAIKTSDERGNLSALSNVASSTTPDEIAPSTTTDLRAVAGTTAGALGVTLTAPGDDGTTGTAQAYDLRWATTAIDATSFAAATPVSAPAPAAAGTPQTFTITGLPNETTVHLALRTRDDAGNLSAVSNDATATTPEVPPAAITDLRTIGRGTGSLMLAWTATGDDGRVGTAVEYDLRWSTSALSDATFAAGTRVPVTPPGGAGVTEGATVSGLAANKTIYLAIKARDDRGNWSPLSNVVVAATEDTLAPGAIGDLVATTGSTAGAIALRWTATGDDDATGTATRYDLRRSAAAITAATWDVATPVTAPVPHAAGTAETMTATGLKGETTFHFAVRAVDEAGNLGPLSNDAAAATPPVAPAAIVDLAAHLNVSGSNASATLTWTAPGDDGTDGQATGYDVRYASSPITAASFASATPAPAAAPQAPGAAETVTVSGLHESTTYYFAVKTVDDTQTWSALSNVPTATVPDLTKPGAPASLAAATPDTKAKRLSPTKVTASSILGPAWDAANVNDGDPTSAWASAGNDASTAETLTLDLGATASVGEVHLTPDPQHLDLFPRDFTIATSADGQTWKPVATEESFTAPSAASIVWGFPPEPARYVRLQVDATAASFGKHYALVADADVYAAAATDGRAQLTWIAPGDDAFTGKAASYQVFRATQPFSDATLGIAVQIPSPPAPLGAGTLQTFLVTGLRGETTYFWGLRAIDEAGNIGPLSGMASAKTNDVAPAAVRTLTAKATGTTSVSLTWTATGDDDTLGTAASYEIRYLPDAISSPTFAQGTLCAGLPPPASSGTSQTVTAAGLSPGVTYHFALVAKDAAGNASHLSNVAVATTTRLPDVTPPAAITNLTLSLPPAGGQSVTRGKVTRSSEQAPDFLAADAVDGDANTFWASAPRSSSQEEWLQIEVPANTTSDRVRLLPASGFADLFPPDVTVRVSPDGLAWTTAATRTGLTASEGQPIVITFTATALRYVEIRATRLSRHASGLYYAALAEAEILTASQAPGSVVASWSAPTDDGPTGRAARYDLRIGACPFNGATAAVVSTSTPGTAGTPERARATSVPSGAACAVIKSFDDAGNQSAASNTATINVP